VASLAQAAPTRNALARVPSPLLVLGGVTSVQFGAAIAVELFASVGPGGAVFLRTLSGAALLLAIWRPRPRVWSRRQWLWAAALGLVLGTMNVTFYQAIHRIPLGIALTFEFVGPLTVAVVGSKRRLDLLWVMLAAAGIVALATGSAHGLNLFGCALALVAGSLWGLYILVAASVGRVFDDNSALAVALCVAAVVALPFGVVEGGLALLHVRSLALGATVGLLSTAIPYSCELEALRRIATNVFGVLMSIEPAMATLAGFVVLGQVLSARQLAGIGFVVIASIGASWHSRATAPIDA
jgi:inner membrane transporter RhtA